MANVHLGVCIIGLFCIPSVGESCNRGKSILSAMGSIDCVGYKASRANAGPVASYIPIYRLSIALKSSLVFLMSITASFIARIVSLRSSSTMSTRLDSSLIWLLMVLPSFETLSQTESIYLSTIERSFVVFAR